MARSTKEASKSRRSCDHAIFEPWIVECESFRGEIPGRRKSIQDVIDPDVRRRQGDYNIIAF